MSDPTRAANQPERIVAAGGGGCTMWLAASGLRAHFAALLEQGTPERWPGFTTVKESTVRRVLRGAIVAGPAMVDVHVKLYRAARLSDQARDLLHGGRARREFTNLLEARRRGLPSVAPLGHGVYRDPLGGSRSFLVTESVAAAPLPRGPLPPEAAARVGGLLRRVHDAGLLTFDLHPGNVLCPTRGELLLVDLTSARFTELSDRDRARGLAFFCLDLDGGVGDPAAVPLLLGYGASALLRDQADRAWRRLRRRALRAFGRRALRQCLHTDVERRRPGLIVYRHRPAGAAADAAVALERSLDGLEPLRIGRRGGVWLVDAIAAKRRRRAAARRLMRAAYWLAFAKVPVPRPLALVLRPDHGAYLSERIDAPDLATELAAGLADDAVREAAARLGSAVGRLHAHGLRNRDLKLENLVRDPRSGQVMMVDLDGVASRSAADARGIAADLGRLLAAHRAAGSPGGLRAVAGFTIAYRRARSALRAPPLPRRHLRARIARRADERRGPLAAR